MPGTKIFIPKEVRKQNRGISTTTNKKTKVKGIREKKKVRAGEIPSVPSIKF